MMNKKGAVVLRDVMFMMLIVSAIFIFTGFFVSEMALNYENTNMSDEWALKQTNTIANSTFHKTYDNVSATGDGLDTSTLSLLGGILEGIGTTIFMVLTAPNTVGTLVAGTLVDMGVGTKVAGIINYLIVGILYAIVIFTIVSAFLKGGKL